MTSLNAWKPLPEGVKQLPLDFIKARGALILRHDGPRLVLGLLSQDPWDRRHLLGLFPERQIKFEPLDSREFSIYLADLHSKGEASRGGGTGEDLTDRSTDLQRLEGDAPVVNLVNSIIMEALKERASDIHLEAFPREVTVRYRVDGVLRPARRLGREQFNPLSSRIKIMANLNIMERRLPQDGRITANVGGESMDLRVSVVPTVSEGESIVLRILNRSPGVRSLDDMGFSREQLILLRRFSRHPHGLILVTGPTGSGKTTTLNGLLSEMASPEKKIITIEDPVEYRMEGIDQIQTNRDIGLTFSALLRRVLRQDPNVIMVGEIRDRETADLAVRAALTGHLVLSSLHTNNAAGAVTRLRDMGVEPFLLAAVLRGIQAQRLVRRLCPECRRKKSPDRREGALLARLGMAGKTIYDPVGCDLCGGSGYLGRTAAAEVIPIDQNLEEMISRGESTGRFLSELEARQIPSLLHRGAQLALDGITTLGEVEGAML